MESLQVKRFSYAQTFTTKKCTISNQILLSREINGYITVKYDENWWLGYITHKDTEKNEVQVSFLHPHGPSNSFIYPDKPDVLTVPFCDVLTSVEATTISGRTYTVKQSDQAQASEALSTKN